MSLFLVPIIASVSMLFALVYIDVPLQQALLAGILVFEIAKYVILEVPIVIRENEHE